MDGRIATKIITQEESENIPMTWSNKQNLKFYNMQRTLKSKYNEVRSHVFLRGEKQKRNEREREREKETAHLFLKLFLHW